MVPRAGCKAGAVVSDDAAGGAAVGGLRRLLAFSMRSSRGGFYGGQAELLLDGGGAIAQALQFSREVVEFDADLLALGVGQGDGAGRRRCGQGRRGIGSGGGWGRSYRVAGPPRWQAAHFLQEAGGAASHDFLQGRFGIIGGKELGH